MITVDVKQLRQKLGLSQEAFGELVGIDQATVSRYENGNPIPKPTMKLLAQIALSAPQVETPTQAAE
jgi:transcriptional regulator with XRE-family HTH domain